MVTRVLLGVSVTLAAAQADWVEHKGEGFTVSFPGKPSDFKQSVKGHTGPVEVKMLVFENAKGDAQYVVSYFDFPDAALKSGNDDKRLDNARDGAVLAVKGTLKEEKKIKIEKHSGREVLIMTKGKIARTRLYAVNKRLYQLAVVGPANVVEQKETKQFFDSFKLSK
jgi:hypothetical protein